MKYILPIIFLSVFSFSVNANPMRPIEKCSKTTKDNVELSECFQKELDNLNKKLEKNYNEALGEAKEFDELEKTTPHAPSPEFTLSSQLIKSQQQFEDYKKTECRRQRMLAGTGSMAGHAQQVCEFRLITQRLEQLYPSFGDKIE